MCGKAAHGHVAVLPRRLRRVSISPIREHNRPNGGAVSVGKCKAVHDRRRKSPCRSRRAGHSRRRREISDSATTVHMVALDDYAIDLSIEDINRWPILVATQKNGNYMSIENSGPSQIVFPYHAFPEIDEATYKVLTIWNLRDMEVR